MASTSVDTKDPEPMHMQRAAQLRVAIDKASYQRLQSVLQDLCCTLPRACEIVADQLLVTEDQVKVVDTPTLDEDDISDDDDDDDDSSSADDDDHVKIKVKVPPEPAKDVNVHTNRGPGSKRLRLRYAMCEFCHEEFDVTENSRRSCRFHPEFPEPDFWAFGGHDEETHGPMDTPENFRAYPEKFVYPCCDRTGVEKGCLRDWHREKKDVSWKRMRI